MNLHQKIKVFYLKHYGKITSNIFEIKNFDTDKKENIVYVKVKDIFPKYVKSIPNDIDQIRKMGIFPIKIVVEKKNSEVFLFAKFEKVFKTYVKTDIPCVYEVFIRKEPRKTIIHFFDFYL